MLRAVARLWDETSPKDARHYDPKARARVRICTVRVTYVYNVAFKLDQKLPSIFYERFISTDFTTRHHITRATSRLYSSVRAAVSASAALPFYEVLRVRSPNLPSDTSSSVVHPLRDSIEKIPGLYGKRFILREGPPNDAVRLHNRVNRELRLVAIDWVYIFLP